MEYLSSSNIDLSDEELLAASVKNPALFSVIFDRYESALRRKAIHILGDKPEVDDIVQDTFTKIYLNANRFKKIEGASFKSWAYRILINVTFTQYRKLQKKEGTVDILDDELREVIADTSIPDMKSREVVDAVATTLASLPDKFSSALRKHFIDDKPEQEIADEEGVSLGAIKTRIHRAKEAYREAESKLG